MKGRFLLSINDTPGVREVFGAFALDLVNTTYTVGASGGRKAAELLIRNF